MVSTLRRHTEAFLLFMLIAVVWSFPLVLHLADHLPGDGLGGDNVAFLWNLWWMRQSGTGFLTTHALFAPTGADLVLHTHTALQGAIAATILRPLPLVVAQNVVIILTLAFNGYAAYLLALDRTKDRVAAVMSGVVFSSSPYVSAHLLGHFNLIGVWTLPLFTLCVLRALERHSLKWSVWTGVCLAAVAYTDYYYTVYCLVIGGAIVVYRSAMLALQLRPTQLSVSARRNAVALGGLLAIAIVSIWVTGGIDRRVLGVRIKAVEPGNLLTAEWVVLFSVLWLRYRPRLIVSPADAYAKVAAQLRLMAPAVALFVCCVSPLIVHAGGLWWRGDYSAPPHFWRSGAPGVDLATLVLGNPFNPLTGAWTTAQYSRLGLDRVEGIGWLGVSVWLALVWALVNVRKQRGLAPVVCLGAFFAVWALGPWLTVLGKNVGLILPQNFFAFVPILSNARIPGRALSGTLLAGALALAQYLVQASPQQRRLAIGGVIALMFVDVLPAPLPLTALSVPAIYKALPGAASGALLELPMGLRDGFGEIGNFDDRVLWYQMSHGRPLVGGFLARIAPSIADGYAQMPVVRSLLELSASPAGTVAAEDSTLAASDQRRALKTASVEFVMLDLDEAEPALVQFTHALSMRLIQSDGHRELFAVTD